MTSHSDGYTEQEARLAATWINALRFNRELSMMIEDYYNPPLNEAGFKIHERKKKGRKLKTTEVNYNFKRVYSDSSNTATGAKRPAPEADKNKDK